MLSSGTGGLEICETVRTELTRVIFLITQALFNTEQVSNTDMQCISVIVSENIEKKELTGISSGLVELYTNTLRAVKKIENFVNSQQIRTGNATVSQVCVNGFMKTSACTQCVERTPPLCLVTCNALVRGCYSPYYSTLNGQFESLWSEIEVLAERVNSTVNNILTHTSALVDFPKLVSYELYTIVICTVSMLMAKGFRCSD